MTIFAIDPGPEKSAFVQFDGKIIDYGHVPNAEMRQLLIGREYDHVAIEMIASYGMAVGASVFNTCMWVGRFCEIAREEPQLCYRKDIKLLLCGTMRSKDKDIRQALLKKLGGQGTKKQPGATYGITSHCWAALAVAVYAKSTIDNQTELQ